MKRNFASNREMVADALSPKVPTRGKGEVLIATNLTFTPSSAAVQKAAEVRGRLRTVPQVTKG